MLLWLPRYVSCVVRGKWVSRCLVLVVVLLLLGLPQHYEGYVGLPRYVGGVVLLLVLMLYPQHEGYVGLPWYVGCVVRGKRLAHWLALVVLVLPQQYEGYVGLPRYIGCVVREKGMSR